MEVEGLTFEHMGNGMKEGSGHHLERLSRRSQFWGSGMGLSICKGIIRLPQKVALVKVQP